MVYEIKIQKRFSDHDKYGHVNNSKYLSYLEVSRVHVFQKLLEDGFEKGLQYVLSESYVKYRIPIGFEDEVIVKLWISEVVGAKFTVEYELHDGHGKIYATAKTSHAIFDTKTGRPIRMLDEIKNMVHNPAK